MLAWVCITIVILFFYFLKFYIANNFIDFLFCLHLHRAALREEAVVREWETTQGHRIRASTNPHLTVFSSREG